MHNLSIYDAYFIVTELGYDTHVISIIPNRDEKCISFFKYIAPSFTIRYVDTCMFMATSLASLASNLLTNEFEKFREPRKVSSHNVMPLVTRNGVYP